MVFVPLGCWYCVIRFFLALFPSTVPVDKKPGRAPLNSMRIVRFAYLTVVGILRFAGRAEGQAFHGGCDGLTGGWLVIQVANATLGEFNLQLRACRFAVPMVAMVFSILVAVADGVVRADPQGIRTTKLAK